MNESNTATPQKSIIPLFILITMLAGTGFIILLNLGHYVGTNFDTYEEKVIIFKRNPIATLGICILSTLFCSIIYSFTNKLSNRIINAIQIIFLFSVFVICVAIVRTNPFPPNADQFLVWHMAKYLEGFDSGIPYSYTPNYWVKYPQQQTTAVLLSWFIRILHHGNEYYFRLLNAILYASFCLGIKILTDNLFESKSVSLMSFLFVVCYIPTLFYVNYVYGTILSMTAVIWGFIFLIRTYKEKKIGMKIFYLISTVLISVIGNAFYIATLIATIAMTCFLLTSFCENIKKYMTPQRIAVKLICIVCFAMIIFGATTAVNRYCKGYFVSKVEEVHEYANSKGMPLTGLILIGISETEGVNGPGSYTGMTDFIFAENNYDTDKTQEDVNDRIVKVCKEYLSGQRSFRFFIDKEIVQWTDPWFASLSMTIYPNLVEKDSISELWNSLLYDGPLPMIERFFSVVMTMILILTFIGCISLWHKYKSNSLSGIYWVLPAFYIIGGFVFQFFWETKSRYCMPYFMMTIPFAAYGCHSIAQLISLIIIRQKELKGSS